MALLTKLVRNRLTTRILGIVLCLEILINCHGHSQPLQPQVDAFRLDRSAVLKGFSATQPKPHTFGVMLEEAPHATWALNARYFHGSSELRYSVLLFPTQDALRAFDKGMWLGSSNWVSPLTEPMNPAGVREYIGRATWPRNPPRTATVVNRVLIIVEGYQHPEMNRRNPERASPAIPNDEFGQITKKVRQELIARARRLPSNKE